MNESPPGPYIHTTKCRLTGRKHERYFDTLHDFVTWHYNSHGWSVPEGYDATGEVMVNYTEAARAVKAAADTVTASVKRLNRHIIFEDDVIVID